MKQKNSNTDNESFLNAPELLVPAGDFDWMISLEKLIYLILINFVLSRKAAWIRSKMRFQST